MKEKKDSYTVSLSKSYDVMSENFFQNNDFDISKLKNSICLFTEESLELREPKPKNLEVYALLSGISFEPSLQKKLYKIQSEIENLIPENLKYYVYPENLGLEHCVFKWPNDEWNKSKEKIIKNFIEIYPFRSFFLEIVGIQIHSDGCIIAKGYDKSMEMNKIRNFFRMHVDFFPQKQSQWSHIPLGRILEPIGKRKYELLKNFAKKYQNINITTTLIKDFKFVFEKRWYMEDKNIIKLFEV